MSGGKGGSTSSSVQIPQWAEDAARANLARADQLAQIGFVPETAALPTIAAFSPAQEAAFQGTNLMASAFGMPVAAGTGMPAPTEYAGGIRGYSAAPLYEAAIADLAASRPGQYAALQAPFIDPFTGAAPGAPFGAAIAPAAAAAPTMGQQMYGGGSDDNYSPFYGDGGSFASSALSAALPGGVNNPSQFGANVRDVFGIGGTGDVANAPRPPSRPEEREGSSMGSGK